jgi:hypothetical protein
VFAVVAAVLGCGLIKAPTLPNLPFYAGIDYFVLTLVLLALFSFHLKDSLLKILIKNLKGRLGDGYEIFHV